MDHLKSFTEKENKAGREAGREAGKEAFFWIDWLSENTDVFKISFSTTGNYSIQFLYVSES